MTGPAKAGDTRCLNRLRFDWQRAETELTDTGNQHISGVLRIHDHYSVPVLGNFSEKERRLRHMGMRKMMADLYAGKTVTATQELVMEPCQLMVLTRSV